jgi:outer membrane immunogenic protein
MRSRKTPAIAGLAVMALGFSSLSAAADGMPQTARSDPYAYNAPLLFSDYWTGIYVGGHAGAATAGLDWVFTNPAERFSQRDTAFAGGAQVGLQKQWGQALFGAEVSYTWSDLGATSGSSVAPGTWRTSDVNNLLMATGRLGATWQNILGYVKGGYASADIAFRSGVTTTGVVTTASSARDQGWVAGLGVEYGIRANILIGIEYDFIHLRADTHNQIPTAFGTAGSQTNGDVDIQTVMARLSFKLGPHPFAQPAP